MSFILPLLFIVCSTGTLVYITKKRFEVVLPIQLMLSALMIYIFGIIGNMTAGYYLCILIAAAFPIIAVLQIKNKNNDSLWSDLFTPGFIIFLAIYVFIYILNYDRGFTVWDEIEHWGPMVKETFRLNKFYSAHESVLAIHKDYPPIVTIFEYLWCRLSGGYRETFIYRALQTLCLSFYFPALSKFKWKKSFSFFIKMIFTTIAILSVNVLITDGLSFYTSIYIDCFIGIMFAYCIAIIIYEKRVTAFGTFNLSVALSFLLLSKQIAIFYFLLILFAYVLNYLIVNRIDRKKIFKRKKLILAALVFIALVGIPCVLLHMWNSVVKSNNISRQFNSSSISISKLIGILAGTGGEAWQRNTVKAFLSKITSGVFISSPLKLNYWQIMLISLIMFFVIGKYGKKYFKKYQIAEVNLTVFLGAIGYALVLLLLYVFCFGSYEGPNLASIGRYVNSYWLGVFAMGMMLFIYTEGNKEEKNKKSSSIVIGIMVLFMWLGVFNTGQIKSFKPALHYYSDTVSLRKDAQIIKDKTDEKSKVYIISQDSNGFATYGIHYLIMPQDSNTKNYSLGKFCRSMDVWRDDLTQNEWTSNLINGGYRYLYLRNIDDKFLHRYSSAFEPGTEIKDNQMYRIVIKKNKAVTFELIN